MSDQIQNKQLRCVLCSRIGVCLF